jgi:hypothetical protein
LPWRPVELYSAISGIRIAAPGGPATVELFINAE